MNDEVYRRSTRTLFGTLAVCVVLLATHLGEFWPFSIYPMFSQAGRPWENVIVRQVPEPAADDLWRTTDVENLEGEPFPAASRGVPQRDLAKLVKEVREWDDGEVAKLRGMLRPWVDEDHLLVYRVRGDASEEGVLTTAAEPFVLLGPDGSRFNPSLGEGS